MYTVADLWDLGWCFSSTQRIHGDPWCIYIVYIYTLQRVFPKRGNFFIEHSISPPQSGWEDNNSTGAICYIDSGGMSTPWTESKRSVFTVYKLLPLEQLNHDSFISGCRIAPCFLWGKTCIVVDDIADTAETLCQAADKLKVRLVPVMLKDAFDTGVWWHFLFLMSAVGGLLTSKFFLFSS